MEGSEPYNFENEDALVTFEQPVPLQYRIAVWREYVRTGLVMAVCLAAYGSLLTITGLFLASAVSGDDALKAAGLLSPIVAAATTVVAFYFREPSNPS